jgi:transposase
MAICDANGLLISLSPESASPHEATLVDTVIDASPLSEIPSIMIGDKAYDSDELDKRLLNKSSVRLIAPNKRNRIQGHEDGRSLRRYSRRWKIERCFAWLQNYRKVATRYEVKFTNWIGFILLAASNLNLKRVLG